MPKPTLTRQQMEDVIKRGEAVGFHGPDGFKSVTRVEDLPSEADLAGDDAAEQQRVRETLVAQKAAIDGELAKLEFGSPAAAPPRQAGTAKPAAAETAKDAGKTK